jgi:phage/plasmid-like protein (TIGR03299 family)
MKVKGTRRKTMHNTSTTKKISVQDATTTTECIKAAGLDYKVELRPIFLQGSHDVDGIPVIGKVVDGKKAVVRTDNSNILGVVGSQYRVVQNTECFGFFDGLVEQGYAKFSQAYATQGGAKVNIVADLGHVNICGDECRKQLILRTSHDGSCAVTVILRVWRLVCSNGMMGWSTKDNVKVRHTKDCQARFKQAKEIIGIADQYYEWFEAEAQKLTSTPISMNAAIDVIANLIPSPKGEKKASTRVQNQRDMVFERFLYGKGNNGETRWDLYNGVTEYVDHYRTKNVEKALESNLVGSGAKLKQQAFNLLTA